GTACEVDWGRIPAIRAVWANFPLPARTIADRSRWWRIDSADRLPMVVVRSREAHEVGPHGPAANSPGVMGGWRGWHFLHSRVARPREIVRQPLAAVLVRRGHMALNSASAGPGH